MDEESIYEAEILDEEEIAKNKSVEMEDIEPRSRRVTRALKEEDKKLLNELADAIEEVTNPEEKALEKLNSKQYSGYLLSKTVKRDEIPKSVFLMAVEKNQRSVVKTIIKLGGKITSKEHGISKTALHIAGENGYVKMLKILLKQGKIYINDLTSNSETPLHRIVRKEYPKCLKLILKYNPDLNIKTRYGETALDIAIKNNWDLGVEILKVKMTENEKTQQKQIETVTQTNIEEKSKHTKKIKKNKKRKRTSTETDDADGEEPNKIKRTKTNEFEKIQKELEETTRLLQVKTDDCAALEIKNQSLEEDLKLESRIKEVKNENIKVLEAQMEKLQQEYSELMIQQKKLEEEKKSLQKNYSASYVENELLKTKNSLLELQNQEKQNELLSFHGEVKTKIEDADKRTDEANKYMRECLIQVEKLQEEKRLIIARQKELDKKEKELQYVTRGYLVLDAENKSLKTDINKNTEIFNAQIAGLNQEIAELQAKLELATTNGSLSRAPVSIAPASSSYSMGYLLSKNGKFPDKTQEQKGPGSHEAIPTGELYNKPTSPNT